MSFACPQIPNQDQLAEIGTGALEFHPWSCCLLQPFNNLWSSFMITQ